MAKKHFIFASVATALILASVICVAFASELFGTVDMPLGTDSTYETTEDVYVTLELENPLVMSDDGTVEFGEDELFDLILPTTLNCEDFTSIPAECFRGCQYIRSVVLPKNVIEVGDNAFADCEFLETIYIIGHDDSDMILGENWSGDANVIFYPVITVEELPQVEEEPAEDDAALNDDDAQGAEDVPADGTNPIDSSTPTDDADPAAHGEGDDANIGDNDKPAGEAGSEGDSNAATGEAGGDAGANVGASEGNDTGSGGNDVESAVEPSMEASDANESGGAV